MTGIGDILRVRREARGETREACAAATGVDAAVLAALEEERIADAGTLEEAARATQRYAMHLELDAYRLADEVRAQFGDDEADTQPIPIVAAMRKMKEPAGLWLAAGAAIGIGLLFVLGSGDSGERRTAPAPEAAVTGSQETPPTTTAPAPSTAKLRPTPPSRPAIEVRLDAQPGKTVWVEVRKGDVSGDQIFAGIVGAGVTRRITSAKPLWLGVAWAPNLKIAVNGEPLDAEGGTESYLVSARGLKRLGGSG